MKEKKKKPFGTEDTPIPPEEFKDIVDMPISMLNPEEEEEYHDPVDDFIMDDIESNIQRKWVRELYEQKIRPSLSKSQDNKRFEEILGDWKKDYSQRRINRIPSLKGKDSEVFGKIIVKKLNGYTLFSVPYRIDRSLQIKNLGYVHIFIGSDRVFHIDTRGTWTYKVKTMNLRHEIETRLSKFGRKYENLKKLLNKEVEPPETLEKAEEYFIKFEEVIGDGDYSNSKALKHLQHAIRILEYAEALYDLK